MALDWYPIIKGKCTKCAECVDKCPIFNLKISGTEKKQLVLDNGYECPDGCEICKENCRYDAIGYYDGTEESILNTFSGECHCSEHS